MGCLIALTLIMTFRIPQGGWIILAIFIVSIGDVGPSLKQAFQRQLSVGIGCVTAISLVILFHQQAWIFIPAMGLVIGVAVYLSRTSAAPSIPILGALTMVLAIGGVDVKAPEGIHIALWRFLDISIGTGIGTFCQAFVWPQRPRRLLFESLADSLRRSSEQMKQALLPLDEVNTDEHTLGLGEERVMNSLAQWLTWLDNAERVGHIKRHHHYELVNLMGDVNQIAIASQQSARAAAMLTQTGQTALFETRVRDQIIEVSARCVLYAQAIEAQSWPSTTYAEPPLVDRTSLTFVQAEGASLELNAAITDSQSTFQATLLSSVISIAEGLDSMNPCRMLLSKEDAQRAASMPGQRPGLAASQGQVRSPAYTLSDLLYPKLNPTDLAAAAKAALGALIAYVYLNAVDWPGGITAVVTAVLVSLDNYGAMIQKSVLRIAGAVIGGAASVLVILLVIPNITGLAPYLVAVGAVCALGAWIQTGSTRIAYTGLQVGLVACLALASSHSPSIDLMPFRDRILGIFTGLASVVIVYGLFGEVRARLWAVDNSAETLRMIAQEASVGLKNIELREDKQAVHGMRAEIYRRIAFSYKLLTEASYEDWLSLDRKKNAEDAQVLHTLLDQTRAIQRVIMSLVWNRLEFQKLSPPKFDARAALEAIGQTVPNVLETVAKRIQQPDPINSEAVIATEAFSKSLRAAEAELLKHPIPLDDSDETKNFHRLTRAQLGFYQQIEILLTQLAKDTRNFSISGDHFSLRARLLGSERRGNAPTIRPA